MGIGMSNEIDSSMAAQAMIWAFGGSIQDENENVIINSPETVAAVEYMANLFQGAMTDEVFGWTAASNNQLLIAGQASYILNSISAYRTAQESPTRRRRGRLLRHAAGRPGRPGARAGPRPRRLQLPDPELLAEPGHRQGVPPPPGRQLRPGRRREQVLQLPGLVQHLAPNSSSEGGWLDNDPYGSEPPDKLAVLKTADEWTVNLGWPGPANAAIGEIFATSVIPNMMARAARGEQTAAGSRSPKPKTEINAIFDEVARRGPDRRRPA